MRRSSYPHKIEHVESGYFRPEDLAALLFVVGHFRGDKDHAVLPYEGLSLLRDAPKGVYYTLNPVKTGAYAKAPARMVEAKQGESTPDADIARRTTLLIDIDSPREVTNVSATQAEKAIAEELLAKVRDFLAARDWPEPIVVDSGNGYQLLYRISLPTDDAGLVERVLNALAATFPIDDGGIDVSVNNAARIARLPYTWNRKGFHTDDRPHRLACVLSLPATFDIVPIELLQSVAELLPAPPTDKGTRQRNRNQGPAERTSDTEFQQAVARWNADHPRSFSTHNSACEICGSPDGFKSSDGTDSRWACFSSRHEEHADKRNRGAGVRGRGCFTGDNLDLEAWASGRTRVQVLSDDGYIETPRSGRRARPTTSDATPDGPLDPEDEAEGGREAVYFHLTSGDVPLHVLAPKAVALLVAHASEDVYVHAGSLAHVIAARPNDTSDDALRRSAAPRIRPYPATVLRERLDAVARWMHESETERGGTKTMERWCPRELVHAVRDRGEWPGLRILTGVTSAPVLRPDLSIVDQPGYDADTALLYTPDRDYPKVPSEPSAEEVARAFAALQAPFAEFPIVSKADQAALVAYVLTLAARPAILGPVPMTGVTARVPGTGKTLLVDTATVAMTGHLPDKLMVPGGRTSDSDAEWRKRIATLAMEGPRAVLIDNVADGAMLQSSALAAALTAEELTERLLATNRTVRVPHRIVWTYSGNNITVAADLARRSLSIDLDANVEDPHLRSSFQVENLLQHARDEHPRLLAAALTVLRGFAAAGRPQHGRPPLGMFEAWDAIVRACVIWLMGDDPLETQARLRGESPETGNLLAVLLAWQDAVGIGKAVQAKDLLNSGTLTTALAEAIPGRSERDGPSSKSVGHYLRRNTGRVVGGLRIECVGSSTGVKLWKLGEAAR